jgi:ATP-dependent DNA ligase
VQKLSREHPAQIVVFDQLADERGRSLLNRPFSERRAILETTFKQIGKVPSFVLSRGTTSRETARGWLKRLGHGLDGIVAKHFDLHYQPGARAMQKFKLWQTVDCVVGGIYYKSGTRSVEYLLMGLYDDAGKLNYVGRSGVSENGQAFGDLLRPLIGGKGFTGNMPGGKSRWSGRDRKPVPLLPRLVAEVSADRIENGHFRHGSRFIRWRDDKEPAACTMDQIIRLLVAGRTRRET